jgi:hypothetical protein
MASRILRAGAPFLLLLCASACTQEPFDRPGTWKASGANDRNLRAMIAEPADLRRGVAPTSERGNAGANAATRLLTEQRRALPSARSTTVGGAQQAESDRPLPGLGIASSSAGAGGGAR